LGKVHSHLLQPKKHTAQVAVPVVGRTTPRGATHRNNHREVIHKLMFFKLVSFDKENKGFDYSFPAFDFMSAALGVLPPGVANAPLFPL
jgi:hypothetical protein